MARAITHDDALSPPLSIRQSSPANPNCLVPGWGAARLPRAGTAAPQL